MPEEKKARLKEYQKNYYDAKKSQYIIIINSDLIVFQLLINYSLSDSLSDEVNSKSSLIRFSTFLFPTSFLHSSKSI